MQRSQNQDGSLTVTPPQVRDQVPTGSSAAENRGIPTPTAIWKFQRATPKRNSPLLLRLLRNKEMETDDSSVLVDGYE